MSIKHCDITGAVEAVAPPCLQESWDNTGWQVIPSAISDECTGVLCCLDVSLAVVDEAIERGCNLIVSHHPLIFRGLKCVSDATPASEAVIKAIRAGIAVYSSHTALDSCPQGPSAWLASQLGLGHTRVLSPRPADPSTGLGIIGEFATPVGRQEFIDKVMAVYGGFVRHTPGPGLKAEVRTVALCSGSGGEFIADALSQKADAYITSDIRYHDFLDRGGELILVDTGHFESEICTKSIFSRIISEKFPNFAVHMCRCEHAPASYAVNRQ